MNLNTLYNDDLFNVLPQIPDNTVNLILTDLPYNCMEAAWDERIDLQKLFKEFNRVIRDDGTILLFSAGKFTNELIKANEKFYRYKYIWVKTNKTNFANAHHAPLRAFEEVLVFYKHKSTYNVDHLLKPTHRKYKNRAKNIGEGYRKKSLSHNYTQTQTGYPSDVLYFSHDEGKRYHSSAKPLKLLEYLIKIHSNEGDIVLDATAGCGSTLIAAQNTARCFIGIEREAKYVSAFYERLNELQALKEAV